MDQFWFELNIYSFRSNSRSNLDQNKLIGNKLIKMRILELQLRLDPSFFIATVWLRLAWTMSFWMGQWLRKERDGNLIINLWFSNRRENKKGEGGIVSNTDFLFDFFCFLFFQLPNCPYWTFFGWVFLK